MSEEKEERDYKQYCIKKKQLFTVLGKLIRNDIKRVKYE